MQLKLHFTANPFTLPINYRPLIHGLIYHALLADPAYSTVLHELNNQNGIRAFKGFTFSPLTGPHIIVDRQISFPNGAWLEIRSVDPEMIILLYNAFSSGLPYSLGGCTCSTLACTVEDRHVYTDQIIVRSLSPIVAYRTTLERKTIFYSPSDGAFYDLTCANAVRKAKRFGLYSKTDLSISLSTKRKPVKQLSRFDGTIIEG